MDDVFMLHVPDLPGKSGLAGAIHADGDWPSVPGRSFAPPRALEVAIVVPVLNEADNIAPLVASVTAVMEGLAWELIIVDDHSPDGTANRARAIARRDSRVRVIERFGRRGLSSAVVEGMMASAAPVLMVMDGDLQHDEGLLPRLYRAVADGGYDLAVGSRYVEGGSMTGWAEDRQRMSALATRLANRLLKTRVGDPMSGFFAIRREAMVAAVPHLSSIGFKLLMDVLASSPTPLKVTELPYSFRSRVAGESKLDLRVTQEFFILLLEKMFGRFLPVRFLMFMMVGSLGLVVHLAILGAMMALHAPFQIAQGLAVFTAMTFNFILNNGLTYRDLRLTGPRFVKGLLSFYAVSLIGAIGNVGVGTFVYHVDANWMLAGIAGVAVGVVWNYAASAAVTWRARG